MELLVNGATNLPDNVTSKKKNPFTTNYTHTLTHTHIQTDIELPTIKLAVILDSTLQVSPP